MENMCMNYENRMLGYGTSQQKLPLLLLTGFLGAGKTTLLRHLLSNKANLRLAVLVNEIGTIDIDGALLRSKDNNAGLGITTEELTNGCVCCSIKDDLRRAVLHVLERKQHLDYLIIETSGAADPRPVAADLHQLCRLDMVVTVVDASAAEAQIATPLGRSQVEAADFLLLNKCDLVPAAALAAAHEALAKVTSAKVVTCQHGEVPLELLMDVQAQGQQRDGDQAEGMMSHDSTPARLLYTVGGRAHFHDKSKHSGFQEHAAHHTHGAGGHGSDKEAVRGGVQTIAYTSAAALQLLGWQELCSTELRHSGVLRVKGFLFFAERRMWRYEVHISGQQRLDIVQDGKWESEPRVQLVIIGKALQEDRIRAALAAASVRDPQAGPGVSVSAEAAKRLKELIAQDINFELSEDPSAIEAEQTRASPEHLVLFGLHQTDNMKLHGVFVKDLNLQLVTMLNALRLPILACPFAADGAPKAMVQIAPKDAAQVEVGWEAIREAAYSLLQAKNIAVCKCGF